MIQEITTITDVKTFAAFLVKEEKLSFHPDDDFNDYVNFETKLPFYNAKDAEVRNRLMGQCFKVCERNKLEIYDVMLPIILQNNGLC
jgi:hypothetical protein